MHSCAGDDGSGLSSHSPAREQPSATSVPPEHLAIAIPLISCPSGGSRAGEARLTRRLERDRNAIRPGIPRPNVAEQRADCGKRAASKRGVQLIHYLISTAPVAPRGPYLSLKLG